MKASKSSIKRIMQALFLLFLVAGTIVIVRQQHLAPYQSNKGFVFGTVYTITYQSDSDLHSEILAELNKVDASLSMFNKESVVSRINRNEAAEPDRMFLEVASLAQKVSEDTGGAFDITVAPLVNAWGFGFKKGQMPSRQQVDSLRALTGYTKIRIESSGGKTRVAKDDPRIMIDCSAIAKGYGCDVVARLLRGKGIKNFMVEIGGEVAVSGVNSKRVPWRIGITKPSEDSLAVNQDIQAVVNVTDKAMATSGNYRNFYYKNGKRYAHTIDPKTGYPVQHNILSATVLAKDCATADAYATAFMVLGKEKSQAVLDRHPELMAYFICAGDNGEDTVWCSPSLKDKIIEEK